MKKILSLSLAGVMMFSALPVAYASDVEVGIGTDVTVTGTQASEYEITVPATLQAGGAGNVIATGTWKSDETLIVTTADEVEVENTETGMKTMVPVVFDGINAAGNDLGAMSISKAISLEKGNILFGEWVGHIAYNVEFKAGKSASLQNGNLLSIDNYDAETGVITLRNGEYGFANWTNIAVTNNDTSVIYNLSDDSMTLSFIANEIGTYEVALDSQYGSATDYVIIA